MQHPEDDAPHRDGAGRPAAETEPPAAGDGGRGAAEGLCVRPASGEEWLQVEEWAAQEEWNPGLGDTACFHPTDPAGFFVGRAGGEPVSAISVVDYSPDFAFLGYYLVRAGLRGSGLGTATWNAALPHAGDRTIGLDAVLEQEASYGRAGFVAGYPTGRYGGRPSAPRAVPQSAVPVTKDHFEAVAALDEECFPAPRREFLRRWLTAPGHRAQVVTGDDGRAEGFGVIRPARSGHRVGPLFARTPQAAEALFDSLTAHLSPDEEVHADIPETNQAAVELATSRGLARGFRSVRMYKGPPPAIRTEQVFGVTSLELG